MYDYSNKSKSGFQEWFPRVVHMLAGCGDVFSKRRIMRQHLDLVPVKRQPHQSDERLPIVVRARQCSGKHMVRGPEEVAMQDRDQIPSRNRCEPLSRMSLQRSMPSHFAQPIWAAAAVVVIAVALSPTPLAALDCTPSTITLSSQTEVDDFQTNHGPCDAVTGTLTISGADIANLDGLAGLHIVGWTEINNNPILTDIDGLSSIFIFNGPIFIDGNTLLANVNGLSGLTLLTNGALSMSNNASLNDLSGLSNLSSIGGSLFFSNNFSLTNLNGLAGLTHVGSNIGILNNPQLNSISGLSGVTGFTASLTIRDNPVLPNLNGLGGFTGLNGLVLQNNDSMTDIDSLAGLQSIDNGYSSLFIDGNASLAHLNGLSDLESLNADLEITDNPMLFDCSGLITLLDQTDDGQPGPGPGGAGIPDVNGDVILGGNPVECNSVNAILIVVIFNDGFESGSTDSWNRVVP